MLTAAKPSAQHVTCLIDQPRLLPADSVVTMQLQQSKTSAHAMHRVIKPILQLGQLALLRTCGALDSHKLHAERPYKHVKLGASCSLLQQALLQVLPCKQTVKM